MQLAKEAETADALEGKNQAMKRRRGIMQGFARAALCDLQGRPINRFIGSFEHFVVVLLGTRLDQGCIYPDPTEKGRGVGRGGRRGWLRACAAIF